jgi:hypothetical protein
VGSTWIYDDAAPVLGDRTGEDTGTGSSLKIFDNRSKNITGISARRAMPRNRVKKECQEREGRGGDGGWIVPRWMMMMHLFLPIE